QVETLRKAMAATADGEAVFDCVQATWNLLEPSAGPALRAAHEAGLGVIVKEALANGRLTARNAEPSFAPRRRLLGEAAGRLGGTPDAVALAAVLAQPWADVVLSGAATAAQLASNAAAASVPWDEDVAERLRPLAERPADYWTTRGRLPWN